MLKDGLNCNTISPEDLLSASSSTTPPWLCRITQPGPAALSSPGNCISWAGRLRYQPLSALLGSLGIALPRQNSLCEELDKPRTKPTARTMDSSRSAVNSQAEIATQEASLRSVCGIWHSRAPSLWRLCRFVSCINRSEPLGCLSHVGHLKPWAPASFSSWGLAIPAPGGTLPGSVP